jgi:hypothetical protein
MSCSYRFVKQQIDNHIAITLNIIDYQCFNF